MEPRISGGYQCGKVSARQIDRAIERRSAKFRDQVNAEFETLNSSAQARFSSRKTWIGHALKSSHKQALDTIADLEGRRKHRLQTETMRMHKTHETGLATAEKTVLEFKTSLVQEEEFLESLRARQGNRLEVLANL